MRATGCLLIFILPGFLWANAPERILQFVRESAHIMALSPDDLLELRVSSSHFDRNTGFTHYYVQQERFGFPIEAAIANVLTDQRGESHLVNHSFQSQLSKNFILPKVLGFRQLGFDSNTENKGLIWIYEDRLWRLAYDTRIWENHARWRIWYDAVSGKELRRKNLAFSCGFMHEGSARENHCDHDGSDGVLMTGPVSSYYVYPIPIESPIHGSRKIVNTPSDEIASPFGWHDSDGIMGPEYTDTRGNNVFAQHDFAGDNQMGYRPDAGSSLAFQYDLDLQEDPANYLDAIVSNLFYWSNLNHDIFYHYGFDEAAGNFQINNYGKAGIQGDPVYADAQDGAGRNNAQFIVEEDGIPGRMEMFLWSQDIYDAAIHINSPEDSGFDLAAVESGFSDNNRLNREGISAIEVVEAIDATGSTHLVCQGQQIANEDDLSGKIVLLQRGQCFFIEKIKRLQELGALGAIVCNNVPGEPVIMGGTDHSITIPAVMISSDQCVLLQDLMKEGALTIDIKRKNTDGTFDSSLDNLIVTHEYGHGISVRLTGGSNNIECLDNVEQMGEGWSDYFGLMLTTDWSSAKAEHPRGIGNFVSSQAVNGRGIRDFPYSTDMRINPMHYDMIKEASITHEVGAVWCSILWDLTWGIIGLEGASTDLYHGDGGNNIALRIVMEALKLQKCSPGFVDGRVAILRADSLLYGGKYQYQLWKAFARRGLGARASQGSSLNIRDGRESYEMPEHFRTQISWFSATDQGDFISIDFTAEQEFDNALFEIERSTDGINYVTLASFEGRTLSEESRALSFEDRDVEFDRLYHYRLNQIDLNESQRYLGRDSALIVSVDGIAVFPNPSDGYLAVKLSRKIIGKISLNLYSSSGKLISSQKFDAEDFHRRQFVDYKKIQPGIYILEVLNDDENIRKRIVFL